MAQQESFIKRVENQKKPIRSNAKLDYPTFRIFIMKAF